MADYWKSQPRKFCQYCKCWIADNKPSVDFHERGKNHKENVSAKIEEIKKKSITKAKQEQKMSKQFAAMEEAALKAYEEDLKRLTSQSDESVSTSPALVKPQIKSTKREVKVKVKKSRNKPAKVWLEGRTDDGQIYYYNTVTGESQWEKPGMFRGDRTSGQTMQGTSGSVWMEARSPEGYTYYFNTETGESSWEKPDELKSLDGSSQAEIQGEVAPPQPESLTTDETASEPPEETTDKTSESKEIKVPKINFRKRQADQCKTSGDDGGPKDCDGGREEVVKEADSCATESPAVKNKRVSVKNVRPLNPYGAWEQIQPPDDPYEKVDLQLPNAEPADVLLDVPSEPKSRFKERTITSLGDESNAGATFKKRKTENGKSRSLRQREDDF